MGNLRLIDRLEIKAEEFLNLLRILKPCPCCGNIACKIKMAVRSWIRTAILHVTLVPRRSPRAPIYECSQAMHTLLSANAPSEAHALRVTAYPRLSLSRATHCPANTQSECPRRTRSVRSPDLRQPRCLVHGAFLRIADNLVIAPVVQRIDPLRLAANLSQSRRSRSPHHSYPAG